MPVFIRYGTAKDAAQIVRLANLLNLHEGLGDGGSFTEEQVLRDGFGPQPAFQVLIAELDGEAIGYALFTDGYNTDIPARGVWLDDIFVEEAARSQGVGQQLMAAVARVAMERGARSVWWGVRSANQRARAFYAKFGAQDDDARILELNGGALSALAAESTTGP